MAGGYFEERIRRTLDRGDPATIQRRLSSMVDRDIAMALESLRPEDAESILVRLPAAKSRRVKQEQEYLGRLKFTSAQTRGMAERLADVLEGRTSGAGGTWIAPGRTRR